MEEANKKTGKSSICHDVQMFQDNLKKMRILDDKIIYTLNSSLPTDSFRKNFDGEGTCKELYTQLLDNYSTREASILQCIDVVAAEVRILKKQKLATPNEIPVLLSLRGEQSTLRQLQTELCVEEIVKERTLKVFNERCRNFYNPDS